MRRFLFAATLLASGSPLWAAEPCVTLDSKATAALFDEWNFSLSSLDANQVAQRYWPNAVLLPTVSNTPRTDAAMISDYFEHFLAKRPRGRIDTRTIQGGCNVAMDMGTYTFSLMDDKGMTSEVSARYTFIYQYRDGAWKILHHHSSAMPEALHAAAPDAHLAGQASPHTTRDSQPEQARATSRKERKPKHKEQPKRAEVAVSAPAKAAVAHAPAAKVAPEAKPAQDAKPASETKPPAEAKPAGESKTATEVKTAMFVNLTSSPPPSNFYPPESARRKERGHVNLKVCADGTGAITDQLEVLKSSGSKLLDEAAMSWARAATWVPATLNRRRVEGCTQVDVAFEANPAIAQARR